MSPSMEFVDRMRDLTFRKWAVIAGYVTVGIVGAILAFYSKMIDEWGLGIGFALGALFGVVFISLLWYGDDIDTDIRDERERLEKDH